MLIFVNKPGGDGEPGLGKPLSSKPGPAELENVRTPGLLCVKLLFKKGEFELTRSPFSNSVNLVHAVLVKSVTTVHFG